MKHRLTRINTALRAMALSHRAVFRAHLWKSVVHSTLHVAPACLLASLLCGCFGPRPWKPIPFTPYTPALFRFATEQDEVRTWIVMFAEGNLFFRFENLRPGYALAETPTVTSPSGSVRYLLADGPHAVQFNLWLDGDRFLHESVDVEITWKLEEQGAEGFLLSEGVIEVDLSRRRGGAYLVNSIRLRREGAGL